MGQKVNPVGFRTGIVMGWKSRWYASKKEFSELLVEDQKIRNFIKNHPTKPAYREAGIDRIEIERTRDEVRLHVYVAKPGLIIGKKGTEIEVLQEELQNLIGRRVNLKVEAKSCNEEKMRWRVHHYQPNYLIVDLKMFPELNYLLSKVNQHLERQRLLEILNFRQYFRFAEKY